MQLISLAGLVLAIAASLPVLARLLEPVSPSPAPQLASFVPWALPVWLTAGALLLVGGPRLLAIVPVAAIALQVRWLRTERDHPPASGTALSLMTLNVLFGRADATATVELVRQHRIDVLVLQEMTPEFVELLQAAGIDALLGHSHLHPRPRSAGTGIWSRWPLRPLDLLPSRGATMPQVAIAVPTQAPDGIQAPDGVQELTVTGVHTVAPVPGRVEHWRADLATLAAAARTGSGPRIFTGDFNASRDHSGFRAVLAGGLMDAADLSGGPAKPGFTWPGDRFGPAVVRLDHVLMTPGSVSVRKVTVVAVRGTDHHGVIADLILRCVDSSAFRLQRASKAAGSTPRPQSHP
jgi:endonuclease/exonuclease/phosphatase (EEP) superfamily protein YafD